MLAFLVSLVMSLGLYSNCGVITEVDEKADTFVITDYRGQDWEMTGIEDWYEGDTCTMIMYDNGTRDIEDDEIVSITYTGYIY